MVVCEECGRDYRFITNSHLLHKHNLTTSQYLEKHPEATLCSEEWLNNSLRGENNPRYIDGRAIKRANKGFSCVSCGAPITGRGKSKLCHPCSMLGSGNPFYGKRHPDETMKRINRSNKNCHSGLEKEIYRKISEMFPDALYNECIVGMTRRFFPDVLIRPNFVIEIFGDYFHANPHKFDAKDKMIRGLTAEEIWKSDAVRKRQLEELGYHVEIIWEEDWKINQSFILEDINNTYNWESCGF